MEHINELRSEVRPASPYIRQITLSGQGAKDWLDTRNTNNRNFKPTNIKKISHDMKSDNFQPYLTLLEIYETGEIADGQNRLAAQALAGKTYTWNVLFNVPLKDGALIDRGVPRSEADAIQIGGLSDWIGRREIPIIKMIVKAQSKNPPPMTTTQIAELGEQLEGPIQFATDLLPSQKRHITTSPVLAAIAMASANLSDEEQLRLMDMGEVLYTGIPESKDDVGALRLREYLMSDRKQRNGAHAQMEDLLKAQRAIKAFVARDQIQKLYTPPDLIYRIDIE